MDPLHFNLLVTLRAAGKFGQRADQLLPTIRVSGHRGLTLPELETALRTLADKSFATPFETALGNRAWRITSLGESALQEDGA